MKKNIIFVISLILINISLYEELLYTKDTKYINEIQKELKDENDTTILVNSDTYLINPPDEENNIYWELIKEDFLNINFNDLLIRNRDTVGWLQMGNTLIDYPIVQTTDNTYYLTHSFDKTKNQAGWIFSDYRNNLNNLNNNTIIYGHRRLDMTMFGGLIKILDKSFFEDKTNQLIKLSTPNTNMLWQIFSVYTIPKESYYITTYFNGKESYQKFLDTILSRSIYDFKTKINTDDKILTLSTCQDNNGRRIVLHAKLIKKETSN